MKRLALLLCLTACGDDVEGADPAYRDGRLVPWEPEYQAA